jgi:prolyl 4-hydroxylase
LQLNDVERGGSTAFPRAGVAVRPVKGSAAYWDNLKRSGKPDISTLHGMHSLPIIYISFDSLFYNLK